MTNIQQCRSNRLPLDSRRIISSGIWLSLANTLKYGIFFAGWWNFGSSTFLRLIQITNGHSWKLQIARKIVVKNGIIIELPGNGRSRIEISFADGTMIIGDDLYLIHTLLMKYADKSTTTRKIRANSNLKEYFFFIFYFCSNAFQMKTQNSPF